MDTDKHGWGSGHRQVNRGWSGNAKRFCSVETFLQCVRQRGRTCMSESAENRPVLECVAALAMKLGGRHLADYGATRSRHDFTQRQLMSCLILRAYLKTTYRGVLEHL